MRVLFFLEPFPVRGRPLDYLWVLERWLSVSQGLARLGASPLFAVSDAVKAARPELASSLLSPADFAVRPDLPEAPDLLDAEWVRLMTEPDLPVWRPFIEALLERTRPDAVVSWTVNAPLRAATAARGIVLMHQELGPMRPPNSMLYFADPRGVNGDSSLPEVWPTLREQPLTPAQQQEVDCLCTELMASPPGGREETARSLGLVPGRKVLSVFLQVPRDSNVLAWSRLEGNEELLRLVTAATSPDSHHVLVRPHPAHPLLPAQLEASHVRQVQDLPAEALINVSDAVLTVNSSVGLEALARGKVVYTFGDSPYAGRGCTRDLGPDPEQLRQALAGQPFTLTEEEELLRRRLLHFLVFRYLTPEWEAWSPEAVLGRLERWRRLQERGAPRWEWFAPEPRGARLGLLRAEKNVAALTARVGHEQARLAAGQAQAEGLRQQLAATTEQLGTVRAESEGLRQQLAATTEQLGTARTESEGLRQQLATTTEQLGTARAETEGLRQQLATVAGALEQLQRSVGHRLISATRRLPGVYTGYLWGKRLLHRSRS